MPNQVCCVCQRRIELRSTKFGDHVICWHCNQTHTFDKAGNLIEWREKRIVKTRDQLAAAGGDYD